MGYQLNLESPQTFNEKLQWLKLNDMDAFKTLCADKYGVREHIKNTIGEQYLIPLALSTTDPKNITAEKIPEYPIIIKTNHASGKVFIIRDKQNEDFSLIQKHLGYQLKKNYYHGHREIQYKNIKPCVIVEKLLMDENGEIPNDYKIHCFNGVPKYIQADSGRFTDRKGGIYDVEWNFQHFRYAKLKSSESNKPKCLEKMVQLAKELSSQFVYARVDFYEVDGQVYFGEITFTPDAGFGKFHPPETDQMLGKELNLKNLL
jgi:hypothetical protein